MKSNHRPYGQDFPGQVATGRFSNGKLVPDFMATMLGIKDIVPPFLDPNLSDEELRIGVSFASAGSEYDDVTSDELYKIGCRTMVVAGLPPIGCIPIQMTAKLEIHRKCIDHLDAQSYNAKLSNLLPELQSSLPGSKIIYADIYTSLDDMMKNPQKYGLNETRKGCCESGLIEAAFLCSHINPVCHSASNRLFWDSVHPSESGYNHLSQSLAAAIIGQLF
ncbi:hypothetical protein ACSBR1_002215 [Camellia fascicularis]